LWPVWLAADTRSMERRQDDPAPVVEGGGVPVQCPITSVNCLSIDVEEYFHCEAFAGSVDPEQWDQFPPRAAPFVERMAGLLSHYGSRATFFVLGRMVDGLRSVLGSLLEAGHEIACHGDGHQHLGRLSAEQLREDLRRAKGRIEDALGVSPRGYRAPTFSVTRATAWALDVIAVEGFQYDASVFPVRHDRYGVPDAPPGPFWAQAPSGLRILEFPPLTMNCGVSRLPVGGGGYLRLFPGVLLRRCVAARQRRGEPVMLYVHPWELDPEQPRLPASRLSTWRHRVNLHTTQAKLERLLSSFRFDTAAAVLDRVCAARRLPVYDIAGHRTVEDPCPREAQLT